MARKPRTTPRKSPRQARARATVDAILTATARVLQREGFDRASTNRVARAAGVSVGSLYQYFPSKEALVAALAERHIEEMSRELKKTIARVAALDLEEAVREVVGLLLRAHAVDPGLHRVLIEQVPRVGRLERLREVELQTESLVRAWLEAHVTEVRACDLDTAAFVVCTAVEALAHVAVLYHPERLESPVLAEEITTLIVRYLKR
jgi:AcrR family transcriptional regulator